MVYKSCGAGKNMDSNLQDDSSGNSDSDPFADNDGFYDGICSLHSVFKLFIFGF